MLFRSVDALVPQAEALRAEGASVMHLAADGRLLGLLAVSDPVKASTPEALAALRSAGLRVVMATGDGLTTARAVSARLGIDEFHGEVKPADTLALVRKLQREGRVVAMAGDGINDAPALAQADVGVAMGTGTDVAMNSAPVTLVKGDLRGIAQARLLSDATIANMKQNLLFAFVYNALGVPLAAGALYPLTGWLLSPMIAALAQADVGIAMGTGTDVAMNSAPVTLVKGDLRGIAHARRLSGATIANMRQNLVFAFVYNALGVPLAAGVLFPFTGWLLSPMIAALAMSLSSASVITNALRLHKATLLQD